MYYASRVKKMETLPTAEEVQRDILR